MAQIILSTATQEIDVTISANSNVEFTACWADASDTGLAPNMAYGVANTASDPTTVVPQTDTGADQRLITYISIVNTDTSNNQIVRLSIFDNASNLTANLIPSANLPPGYGLYYIEDEGFQILDANALQLTQNTLFSGDVSGQGTTNVVLTLANTGVNAGAYIFTNLTVAANGRVMLASNGANANTTVRGVTLLIDSVSSNDIANAATANSVTWAFDSANANALAAYAQANLAYAAANSAQTAANAAANTVAVYANGTLVLADGNVNFNNTATVNVGITANGTTQTNVALNANVAAIVGPYAANANAAYAEANAAYAQANSAYAQANLAYAQANSQGTYANGTSVVANVANINFNNTATTNVSITANASQTNVALTVNAAQILSGVVSGNTSNINVTLESNGQVQIDTRLAAGNGGGGGAYQVDIYANGTLTQANSDVNFNNTATVNVKTSTNGSAQVNVAFTVNSSAICPGSNTDVVFNNGGVLGATPNLTFDGQNLLVNGNVQVNFAGFAINLEPINVSAQGIVVVVGTTGINFNNTATINTHVTGSSNANVEFNLNVASLATVIYQENFVATSNQTVFTLLNPLAPANVNYLLVNRNGVTLEPITHYTLSGQTLTLLANCATNDVIDVREFIGANIQMPSVILNEQFTSTANQTVFTLNNTLQPANVNYVMVFRNGLEQAPTTDYTLSGQNLTFTSNTLLNDLIEVREFIGINVANGGFAAGANQQVQFNLNGALAGSANLTFDTAVNTLNVAGNLNVTYSGTDQNIAVFDSSGTSTARYITVVAPANNGALLSLIANNRQFSTNDFVIWQETDGTGAIETRVGDDISILTSGSERMRISGSNGAIKAVSSPLANAVTRVATGLAAVRGSTTNVSTTGLTNDPVLILTFNETGMYHLEVFVTGYNISNTTGTSGFKVDVGNDTTSKNVYSMSATGFSNAAFSNIGVTLTSTVVGVANVGLQASGPSWIKLDGVVGITGAGILGVRSAQVVANATQNLTIGVGSYIQATKIG